MSKKSWCTQRNQWTLNSKSLSYWTSRKQQTLWLKPKMLKFCASWVKYLGPISDYNWILMDPTKVEELYSCLAPHNFKKNSKGSSDSPTLTQYSFIIYQEGLGCTTTLQRLTTHFPRERGLIGFEIFEWGIPNRTDPKDFWTVQSLCSQMWLIGLGFGGCLISMC